MTTNRIVSIGGFIVFAAVYYLPLFAGFDVISIKDIRAQAFFFNALFQKSVLIDVAINLGTHIGLLLAIYLVAVYCARGLQRFAAIRYSIALALALICLFFSLAAINAELFPKSSFNVLYAVATDPNIGAVASLCLFVFAAVAFYPLVKRHYAPLLVTAALGIISFSFLHSGPVAGKAPHELKHRNIIIIGVDSLSRELLVRHKKDFPAISALYDAAISAPEALTPIGRTFPAWITTLSGQPSAVTGAYFNLTEIRDAQKAGLLSQALTEQGYQTVFAIDERRFCNIDQTYGFEEVLGPKPGVMDFALQGFNELPLTNLLLQTSLGGLLLKHSYMNTASHVNYDEDAIIRGIARVIDDRPLFLAVHFESAHFPFKTRFKEYRRANGNYFLEAHLGALQVVNRQVAALMDSLRSLERLDDAIVVLMSDHGEGFGEVESVVDMSPEPLVVQGFGHGTNLLSQDQHNIVLGVLQFVNGEVSNLPSSIDGSVSLRQVRPTIERYLREGIVDIEPEKGCIALETGLRPNAAADYRNIDPETLIREVASYYIVTGDGRLIINPEELPELVKTKDIAVLCKDTLTLYRRESRDINAFDFKQGAISLSPPGRAALADLEDYRARLYNIAELR